MEENDIEHLFEKLFRNNKYLLKIKNPDYDWKIYFYKNIHIKLDIESFNTLQSSNLDVRNLINYIKHKNDLKIVFEYYNNDLENYKSIMLSTLKDIQTFYEKQNKAVTIKEKIHMAY